MSYNPPPSPFSWEPLKKKILQKYSQSHLCFKKSFTFFSFIWFFFLIQSLCIFDRKRPLNGLWTAFNAQMGYVYKVQTFKCHFNVKAVKVVRMALKEKAVAAKWWPWQLWINLLVAVAVEEKERGCRQKVAIKAIFLDWRKSSFLRCGLRLLAFLLRDFVCLFSSKGTNIYKEKQNLPPRNFCREAIFCWPWQSIYKGQKWRHQQTWPCFFVYPELCA